MSGFIIEELRKALGRWREGQAAKVFRDKLDSGQIEFRIRGDAGDWIAPDHIWTTAADTAPQVRSHTGGALERSLFLPVYASELNGDETKVAVYLDAESAIKWWHRNSTDRGSYALRGWRRGNVYPDFVFAALKGDAGERIVAMEAKGDQLAGNLDTEYKRQLLKTLTGKFGNGAAAFPAPAQSVDYEAAVVLFSEWQAKLPKLIAGGRRIVPRLSDHDPWAQCRIPMDMMRKGCSTRLFQAKQQWSTISSQDLKMRFESQLSRMNCQRVSTGLSSGHLGGSGIRVMLGGTISSADPYRPA